MSRVAAEPLLEPSMRSSSQRGLGPRGRGGGRGAGVVGGLGGLGGGWSPEESPPERGAGGGGGGGMMESAGSDTASAASDINYMHESLRQYHPEEDDEEGVRGLYCTKYAFGCDTAAVLVVLVGCFFFCFIQLCVLLLVATRQT